MVMLATKLLDSREKLQMFNEDWSDIVRTYTKAKLTVLSDRLPAMLGVASIVPGNIRFDTPGDEVPYIAGLWRDRLPLQLLWQVTDHPILRSPEYGGPSWSWTSVEGAVDLVFASEPSGLVETVYLASIEDIEVTSRFPYPFVHVTSGVSKIRGQTGTACPVCSPANTLPEAPMMRLLKPDGSRVTFPGDTAAMHSDEILDDTVSST